MKSAGTSVEWALAMKSPLGPDDISTGHTHTQWPGYNQNSLYGDWQKNMETYPFLGYGKGEHHGPEQVKLNWHLFHGAGRIEEYKKYTVSRNPWNVLVSYYWYAHSRKSMLAFFEKTAPMPGDYFEDVRNKFQTWGCPRGDFDT